MDDVDGREQEWHTALARGREFADRLVGLPVADAQMIAAEHAEVWVQFVPASSPVTADLRHDRVRAFTRDGVVIDARAG